jgi:hypothetical protein
VADVYSAIILDDDYWDGTVSWAGEASQAARDAKYSTRRFTSLALWEDDRDGNAQAGDNEFANIFGPWVSHDGDFTLDGWTNLPASITIQTIGADARSQDGKYGSNNCHVIEADYYRCLDVELEGIVLNLIGLQFAQNYSSGDTCILIDCDSSDYTLTIEKCYFVNLSTPNSVKGIWDTGNAGGVLRVKNSISDLNGYGEGIKGTPTTAYIYNCTVTGYNGDGIEDDGGTWYVKNCAVFDGLDDFDGPFSGAIDYCASDDGNGTNPVSPSGGSWNNEFTDYSNGDFTIKDTSANIYLGSEITQADDAEVPSDDIIGTARNTGVGEQVCIGAYEYVSGEAPIEAEASDGFAMGEAVTKIAVMQGAAIDGLQTGDAPAKLAQLLSQASDGTVMGDIGAAMATFLLSAADGLAGGDTPIRTVRSERTATDGLNAGDTPGAIASLFGQSADGLKAGDIPETQGQFQGTAVDGLTLAETLVAAAILVAIAGDGAKFGDTPLGDILGTLIGEAIDGVRIGDAPSGAGTFLKAVADGFALGEALSVLLTAIAAIADGVQYGDTPLAGILVSGIAQDGIVIGETLQRVLVAIRESTDAIVASDTPVVVATFQIAVSDTVKMGETLATLMTFFALVSDGFTMSDMAFHVTPGGPGEVNITFNVRGAGFSFQIKKSGVIFGARAGKIEIN